MSNEEWADIPNFVGYQVSTLGRVRSLDRIVACRNGRTQNRKGKILRPAPSQDGYPMVVLCIAGVPWTKLVHDLVASAFLGERPEGHEVHHRNTRRDDNRLSNLSYRPGDQHLIEHFTGEANPAARLTDTLVSEIKSLLEQKVPQTAIAKYAGVHKSQITRIKKGQAWAHIKTPATDDIFLSFTLETVPELAF